MKIYLGSDHGGFELKQELLKIWKPAALEVTDLGCYSSESVNYPDLAASVCSSIIQDFNAYPKITASEDAFTYGSIGILFCGSGQGMAMKANKYAQIRAALCWNDEIGRLSREHNNANILCLPGRYINSAMALSIVQIFLTTPFAKGRHAVRVDKI